MITLSLSNFANSSLTLSAGTNMVLEVVLIPKPNIEKYIYIQKSEIEEFEKAWSPWNDFINHLAV